MDEEKVTVYVEKGKVHTAYGHHKFNLSDFGY